MYANTAVGDPRSWMLAGFQAAHRAHQGYEVDNLPNLHGMGTTYSSEPARSSPLLHAHVGDSRLYLVHKWQLTAR